MPIATAIRALAPQVIKHAPTLLKHIGVDLAIGVTVGAVKDKAFNRDGKSTAGKSQANNILKRA